MSDWQHIECKLNQPLEGKIRWEYPVKLEVVDEHNEIHTYSIIDLLDSLAEVKQNSTIRRLAETNAKHCGFIHSLIHQVNILHRGLERIANTTDYDDHVGIALDTLKEFDEEFNKEHKK